MVLDNISLLDEEDLNVVPKLSERTIKFKKASFTNIFGAWKNFRLSRLAKKLEKAKDKLVTTKGTRDDKYGAEKIKKRATVVARLEEKISILATGKDLGENYVKSRKIKLKSAMLSNMRYNSGTTYSVPEEKYESIFATDIEEKAKEEKAKQIAEEEQKNLAKNVQDLMDSEEKETIDSETLKNAVDDEFKKQEKEAMQDKVISPDEVAAVVGEKTDKIDVESEISSEEVKDSIDAKLDAIDVEPEISSENLKEAIAAELEKVNIDTSKNVKVTQNGSKAARINPFINEDGTYHMKKEDIDEDFRKTTIDRSKISGEGDIKPIKDIKTPEFKDASNAVKVVAPEEKGLNDDIFGKNPKKTDNNNSPKEEKVVEDKNVRDEIVVVKDRDAKKEISKDKSKESKFVVEDKEPAKDENLHFDLENTNIQDLTNAIDHAKTAGDLDAIISKIELLKAEQAKTRAMAEEAAAKAAAAEAEAAREQAALNKKIQEAKEYSEALQEDCNFNLSKKAKEEERQHALELKAQQDRARNKTIESLIAPKAINVTVVEEKGGKRR